MFMPIFTIVVGDLLLATGLIGYFATGSESPTALIPAAFGLLFNVLGALAFKPNLRKHAMHGAAVLALLAVLGTARGLLQLPTLLGGGLVTRPAAVVSQSVTAVVALVYLAVCVKSFRDARRKG
ncbi:MAG: hypothetical protein SFV54_08390 [Bryobacteraceae bacterium]|nr:hypothetical protein [Bryobacteraceae bacterium]